MKRTDHRRQTASLLFGPLFLLFMLMLFPLTARALTPEDAAQVSGRGWQSLPDGRFTCIKKGKTPYTGFQKIGQYWYHFDEEGYLSRGWFTVGGKRYYAAKGGKLGKKKGSLKSGYQNADGQYCMFSTKEKAGAFGRQQLGWVAAGKSTFYYDQDGTKLLGLNEIKDSLYYFAPGGNAKKRGRLKTGWKTIAGKKYYFRSDGKVGEGYGAAYRNTTVTIKGTKYYFDEDGAVAEDKTKTTAELTASQKKFIETLGPMAHANMESSGVLASVTLAQAIVESAWGTSELAVKAHNLFGMKAALSSSTWKSPWTGETYSKNTLEYLNGRYVTIKDSFRKYKSIAVSVADHSAYLTGATLSNGNKRYSGIVGCKDYTKAVRIIKNGGYATAPNYVPVLVDVIEKYNLTKYD